MSATKKEDNLFMNETRLLVRNDRTPKKNKALNNINYSFTPTDDGITLANKKENSLRLLNDRIGQRAENPTGDFITKSNYDPERDELLKEYNSQHPSSFEYTDENGNKKYRKLLLPEFDVDLDNTVVQERPLFHRDKNITKQIDDVLKSIAENEKQLAIATEKENSIKNYPNVNFLDKAKLAVLLHNIERRKAYYEKELANDKLKFDGLQRRRDFINQDIKDVER